MKRWWEERRICKRDKKIEKDNIIICSSFFSCCDNFHCIICHASIPVIFTTLYINIQSCEYHHNTSHTFWVGTGCLAKGGSGGDPPPRNEFWVERVETIDRLSSGARLRALILKSLPFFINVEFDRSPPSLLMVKVIAALGGGVVYVMLLLAALLLCVFFWCCPSVTPVIIFEGLHRILLL